MPLNGMALGVIDVVPKSRDLIIGSLLRFLETDTLVIIIIPPSFSSLPIDHIFGLNPTFDKTHFHLSSKLNLSFTIHQQNHKKYAKPVKNTDFQKWLRPGDIAAHSTEK